MAQAGHMLQGGGKRLIFRETSRDTGGARLSFDEFVNVDVGSVPPHIHPRQTERFTVVSGTLGVRVAGQEKLVRAGEWVSVPPGVVHTYWNAGADELHQTVTLEPALRHKRFFESVYGLAAEEFTPERRTLRNALLAARLFAEHEDQLADVPPAVQRLLFPPLAALGQVLGMRVWKPEFIGRHPS